MSVIRELAFWMIASHLTAIVQHVCAYYFPGYPEWLAPGQKSKT